MSILSEMTDRLKELVDADVHHDPKLHEYGNHCEGCERIDLLRMLRMVIETEDDVTIQKKLHVVDEQGQSIVQNVSRKDYNEQVVSQRWGVHKDGLKARAKRKSAGPR